MSFHERNSLVPAVLFRCDTTKTTTRNNKNPLSKQNLNENRKRKKIGGLLKFGGLFETSFIRAHKSGNIIIGRERKCYVA